MTFEDELNNRITRVTDIITSYLPKEEGYDKTVKEAMNYSFLAGGKRLRPLIMLETFEALGGKGDVIYPFMAALEMVHNYSLVHDDLPAIDNDELRRGRPTTHKAYGESMAILAGDGLLSLSFETAVKAFNAENADPVLIAGALSVFVRKIGMDGMLSGESVDVEVEKKNLPVDMELLMYIHEKKTAALLECAFMVGGILAGCDTNVIKTLEQIGSLVGISFQIRDDILDIIGNEEELGKPIGSDEKNGKITSVSINGLEKSEKDVEEMSEKAVNLTNLLPGNTEFLVEIVKSLVYRNK